MSNRTYINRYGCVFRASIGGCYPANNGDPQCDDPDIDIEEIERAEIASAEDYLFMYE